MSSEETVVGPLDGLEERPNEEIAKEATGVKESVSNDKALHKAQKEEEAKVEKENNFDYPSLFIKDDDTIKISVQIIFDAKDGKPDFMSIVRDIDGLSELKYLKRVIEWAEFSIPTYDNMVAYRESSMYFEKITNQYLSDPIKMRLCYIRYHLKNWSIKNSDGNPVELEKEGSGLSDYAMVKVGSIMPSLMDLFLSEFEKESMLLA